MTQTWRDLLFAHVEVSPDWVQSTLPPGLSVDTHQGKTYVGLVPFKMERIKPVHLPPVPYLSWFLETNIRTYVTHEKWGPGVWFYSLDSDRYLANLIARTAFALPYFGATMSAATRDGKLTYQGTRSKFQPLPSVWSPLKQDKPGIGYDLTFEPQKTDPRTAMPATLDHFLLERYRLFSCNRQGDLFTGRVAHVPYTFNDIVNINRQPEGVTLLASTTTIEPGQEWSHLAYSPGVDVTIFPAHRAD